MEPHRPYAERGVGSAQRRDHEPMNVEWLERLGLRYIARWEASQWGVSQLLERKVRERCERTHEPPEEPLALIPGVVEQLASAGYVDDRRFAEQLLERLRRQGRARSQIRATLRAKGVADPLILELTRESDPEAELEAAFRLARRRGLGPFCRDPDRRIARRETDLAALARQGFSREIAISVVDADPEGSRCT